MDNPIIIIILIVLAAVLFLKFRKKNKPVEIIDEPKEELGSDENLAILKAYHLDKEIKKGQIIVTEDKEPLFKARGFDIKEKEVELKPGDLTWGKSCPCVKFTSETGDMNFITCSSRGSLKRNVWVKYKNGVTFAWKIQFL